MQQRPFGGDGHEVIGSWLTVSFDEVHFFDTRRKHENSLFILFRQAFSLFI
jgi:hypothetical protein